MFQNSIIPSNSKASGGTGDPTLQQQDMNFNGMQQQQQQQQQAVIKSSSQRKRPYVKIIEQPASKALRFRYECEGRSAGSIPGVNSTPETKTYPTIEIVGYKGRAVVVVSCVTKDSPYRPHPHNLVGKDGCKKGVCTLEISCDTMRAVFSNLGIQCVKKRDIEPALKAREDIRVDPYKTGFSHRFQPASIDLNAVRLCFQVFLESDQKGRFTQPLAPIVSDPIFDKKAMSDLVICRLCSCSATVLGNTQIILLCEKVAKEDITVRFFEERNGVVIWEAFGDFHHTDVHKQTAIAFKTPRYHTLDITEPAKVFVQLRRPSDGVTSEALPFEYIPLDTDSANLRRKRQKTAGNPMHLMLRQQQKMHKNVLQESIPLTATHWNQPNTPEVKKEPRDSSPQPFAMYRAAAELTPSPQPLSPSNNYTHNNTPSPYSMAAGGPIHIPNNAQLISPNHNQFIATSGVGNTGPRLPGASPMDISEYSTYTPQHQQGQQFHANNIFVNDSNVQEWKNKFTPDTSAAAATTNNNRTMSNLTNPFIMENLLTETTTAGTSHQQWNLSLDSMSQHPQYQHQASNEGANNNIALAGTVDNGTTTNNNNNNNNNNNDNNTNTNENENGPTISNLLSFDSEQLLHMNSEDQQMLRLNSEDLQISNLSIST